MKRIKIFLVLFGLVIMNGFILARNASADSIVVFKGGAENFVFYPDGDFTDTDLFGSMKNMLPGDIRTENIVVRNTTSEFDNVKIYLRAQPAEEVTGVCQGSDVTLREFLENFTLSVKNNGEIISDSLASNPAVLTENVLLGDFHSGEETNLSVEVTALETLSNRFEYCSGEVKWIFTAEGFDPIAPNTGFFTNTESNAVYIVNIFVFLFAIIIYIKKNTSASKSE